MHPLFAICQSPCRDPLVGVVGSGTLVLYPSPLSSTVPSRGPRWLLVLRVESLGGGDGLLGIDWCRSTARKRSYLLELYFWRWKEGGHVIEVLPGKGWVEETKSYRRQEPGPGDTLRALGQGPRQVITMKNAVSTGPLSLFREVWASRGKKSFFSKKIKFIFVYVYVCSPACLIVYPMNAVAVEATGRVRCGAGVAGGCVSSDMGAGIWTQPSSSPRAAGAAPRFFS